MLNLVIRIPEKISTNKIYSGIHWTKRSKHKDVFYWEVKSALNKRKIQGIEFLYPICIDYDFRFKMRPLDTTNCTYMAKMIEDALVKCNILTNDSPKYVAKSSFVSNKNNHEKEDICVINFSHYTK